MSYEDAPSTIMLATRCACCGRPLRDALSVEAGVGPDCRERWGYGEAQGPEDLELARGHLLLVGLAHLLEGREDARARANAVAHAFACRAEPYERVALARACAALGFSRMSGRLAEVVAEVIVRRAGDAYEVEAPYLEGAGQTWRRCGGTWDPEAKVWRCPSRLRSALWGALRALYPGRVGLSAHGLFFVDA
jgi:hypothetical protein